MSYATEPTDWKATTMDYGRAFGELCSLMTKVAALHMEIKGGWVIDLATDQPVDNPSKGGKYYALVAFCD